MYVWFVLWYLATVSIVISCGTTYWTLLLLIINFCPGFCKIIIHRLKKSFIAKVVRQLLNCILLKLSHWWFVNNGGGRFKCLLPDLWVTQHLSDGVVHGDLLHHHCVVLKHLCQHTQYCVTHHFCSAGHTTLHQLHIWRHPNNKLSLPSTILYMTETI